MRSPDTALRVLIADDEAPARRQLRRVLRELPDVLLVGEAADGLEAANLAESLRPDVLILDIQMPQMDGLDVAANLPWPAPQVIFLTAFDAHALRAFDLAAVDYLLKPWDTERLLRALERARGRLNSIAGQSIAPPRLGPVSRVVVRHGDALHVIATDAIFCVAAQDNYVALHTIGRDWMLREPLGALIDRLQHPEIIRVHRSHAVNLAHVVECTLLTGGDSEIVLADGYRVPCSRTYRELFRQKLNALAAARSAVS